MTLLHRKKRVWFAAALLVFAGIVFLVNHQGAASPGSRTLILAHRGVSQTFPPEAVDRYETCTARIIRPPTHPFLENTIASMRESFRLGADRIEFDIHPTTDGQFAVFHDWTVDCRTEGHGVTRDQSMAYLKTLDIGYGYTADGGKTFPFRGKGAGLMPSLDEVLAAFPGKRMLINIKSDDAQEGVLLAARLRRLSPQQRALIQVYGGGAAPQRALKERLPDLQVMSKDVIKSCLLPYVALGWSGHVPGGCRNVIFPVPVNLSWLVWGWPYKFTDRMKKVHATVWVTGPYKGGHQPTGVDSAAVFERVPANFDGEILTNEIGLVAPLLRARQAPPN